ncbi:hypothetical protein FRC03_002082 [Tulasnella sp. 419]|nr:hypothetical protein FRC02_001534 [Tulasnella sp. 418]KAG8944416.1 hypothetical protein FRC03_002082 [Tulasnella sp. 419]
MYSTRSSSSFDTASTASSSTAASSNAGSSGHAVPSSSSSFIDGFNKGQYKKVASFVNEFALFVQQDGKWMDRNDINLFRDRLLTFKESVSRYQSLPVSGQLAEFFNHKADLRNLITDMKKILRTYQEYRTDHMLTVFIENTAAENEGSPPAPPPQARYEEARQKRTAIEKLGFQANGLLGSYFADKPAMPPPQFAVPHNPQDTGVNPLAVAPPSLNTTERAAQSIIPTYGKTSGWDTTSVGTVATLASSRSFVKGEDMKE